MYDIIIIGAGPAGMTAAIYGQRAGKTTLLLDGYSYGGQVINTPEIENYPGLKKVSGLEFANDLYEQMTALGAEIKYEKAVSVEKGLNKAKLVSTEEGGKYMGRSVIIATGAKNRPMGIAREDELTGMGISYCATCDGAFFRNKDVAVVGGGNTALEDAEVLSGLCNKVYLVHRRDEFRGDAHNVARLSAKDNVEFVLNSTVEALRGEHKVSGITVKDKDTGALREIDVEGIFVAIGQVPDNKAFENLVELSEAGYVKADESCKTSAEGIFVAGDCRTKKVRQITTATADGSVAALSAVEYINSL
ncbi:thioredoxin reductase (NADPH) [Peptostreptococcaceae bacterium pGA-8]|nr:thioredoxin reductase (NADPH) [Peptostreptococcaceae bacterium pGA-8]